MTTEEKIKELHNQIDQTREKMDEVCNSDLNIPFEVWWKKREPYQKQISILSYKIRVIKSENAEWEDLPDYGDLMPVHEFVGHVKSGGFIDDDGYGKYSDGKRMSNITIYASDITNPKKDLIRRKDFTHVVWFNK